MQLEVGRTYFQITYADADSTMIGVKPLVYVGEITLQDGSVTLGFQETVSYVRSGSCLESEPTDQDRMAVCLIPSEEIGVDVVNFEGLFAAVKACLSREKVAGFPVLPILKKGWFAAT